VTAQRIVLSESRAARFQEDRERIVSALTYAIVGQEALIRQLVDAALAGGHMLIEGLPGLGKTHLAIGLANAVGLPVARIQCTPDLMPSDVTGSEILIEGGGERRLEFRPGPIFANMVLVDEINRATPKTQSALLEAMQEKRVTFAGVRHALPAPFWVMATQNPIEIEGTYPLPEAQLDRFMCKLLIRCPEPGALIDMIDRSIDGEPTEEIEAVLPPGRILEMMAESREILIAASVKRAAVDLVLATHPELVAPASPARRHLRYGASPRALQAMLRLGRVRALGAGRGHVTIEDIAAVALPCLRHRALPSIESTLDAVDLDQVIEEIVATWSTTLRPAG
jgi:MoxR-like ATPase